MRIRLEVDGETFDVEVRRDQDKVTAETEGETLEATVVGTDGPVRVRVGDQAHVIDLRTDADGRLDGVPFRYRVDAFQPGEPVSAAGEDGHVPVRAAMQGRLVKVLAKAGDEVDRGQALFIIESMKMQNELQSPAGGRLADVPVSEGDVVESGRLLAMIEVAKPTA